MKNLLLALFASLFLFSSCLDDNEVKFSISGSAYLFQEMQQDSSFVYYPYLTVYSTNMEHSIKDVSVENNTMSIPMSKQSDYVWISQMAISKPTDINGTFGIYATNQDDKSVSESISFAYDDKDILGEVKVDTLEYSRNTLTASLSVPTNAKVLGFFINAFNNESDAKQYNNVYYPVVGEYTGANGKVITLSDQAKDGRIKMQLIFDTDSEYDMAFCAKARVGVYASSKHAVYRVADGSKVVSKNEQSF